MIDVIDYGVGNIGSIINMLKRIGVRSRVVKTAEDLQTSQKIILPGVGAFDSAMKRLKDNSLEQPLLERAAKEETHLLGICLGMHLLTRESEEGKESGLGLIPGAVKKFISRPNLKVPHMGWNEVSFAENHPLGLGFEETPRFYFVHSYHVVADSPDYIIGTTRYGSDFPSIIQKGNIIGAQFHPEKSHKFGQQLLKNFAEL